MDTHLIRSRDATFQKFEVLKTNRNKRHRYGEFFVEGVRNINEAIHNGWAVRAFLSAQGVQFSNWARQMLGNAPLHYQLLPELMAELSGKGDTSELLAVIGMRDDEDIAPLLAGTKDGRNPLFALFDRPSNRGNLGTLLRSCDALGVSGLIITGHAVDIYDPDVVSASMGSFFRVPFVRLSDNAKIDALFDEMRGAHAGLSIMGTTAHKQKKLYEVDMTGPMLIMLGNETDGLNQHLVDMADVLATIPMSETSGASSLNVSCAATALFYEVVRQRATFGGR